VTAADVVRLVYGMLHPVRGSHQASILYCIQGARAYHQGESLNPDSIGLHAVDHDELVMQLEEPIAYALHLLTLALPVPRHAMQVHGDAWAEAEHIVTNGPFALKSWEPGVSMTLERNHDYCGRVRGNVCRVELRFPPPDDWPAQLAMYEADELDLLNLANFPPSALDDARRRHPGEYISIPALSTFGIAFNTRQPPFEDPRVRQALAMAIDKETLSGVVLAGTQYPGTGGFVPPGMLAHLAGIGLPFDVAHAQRVLAEAGYPDGHGMPAIKALVQNSPSSLREAEFVRGCWLENLAYRARGRAWEWRPSRTGGTRRMSVRSGGSRTIPTLIAS